MFDRLIARTAGLAFAALMTFSVLGGIDVLAVTEHAGAEMAAARSAAHTVQASAAERAPRS